MSNSLSANNIKIPSKRGRKKKEVPQNEFMLKILQVEEPVANTSPKEEQHNNCDPVSEEDKLEAPTIKKRGRKPKETKASIVDIDAVGNKKMPLILMLPISSSMVSMDSLTSMTQPISLFEGTNDNYYSYDNSNVRTNNIADFDAKNSIPSIESEKEILKDESYSDFLLEDFMDSNSRNSWPETTKVHCWWCSLSFKNSPVGLPTEYQNNKFRTLGCFCSYNCALSYNLANSLHEKHERTSLLHQMYKKQYNEFRHIKAAPPKEILTIYGGNVSIEDYKKELIENTATYSILIPPLVSIIPQMEKYNNNINIQEDFIPVNNNKLQKASQSLNYQERNLVLTNILWNTVWDYSPKKIRKKKRKY